MKFNNYFIKKIKSIYFVSCLFLFNHLAFALATGQIPYEISNNTNMVESVLGWILKIGGMGSIIYGGISFARGKLQGQAIDTVIYIVLGLGAIAVGLGWWLGQSATSSAGFAFS